MGKMPPKHCCSHLGNSCANFRFERKQRGVAPNFVGHGADVPLETTPMQNSPHTKLTDPIEANNKVGNFIVEFFTRSLIMLSATITLATVAVVV